MIFYTYKTLQDKLKELGLPCSRMYLTAMEQAGAISKPKHQLMFHYSDSGLSAKAMRIFDEEDIQNIILQVRQHSENKNAN